MNLRGWNYTGRNISRELHQQYQMMCRLLSDASFVNHQTWGTPLQEQLAKQMDVPSAGAVRTIKKVFVNFGFLDTSVINIHTELYGQPFLTKQGEILLEAATLEEQLEKSSEYDEASKKQAYQQIKNLYEEVYCEALLHYYIQNDDGQNFSPLRATLRALSEYHTMDKWEWYLMNTFIRHDDKESEWANLDRAMTEYRNGAFTFTMKNVIEQPKGHQYTPQHYAFAGLVSLFQRPAWLIGNSDRHEDKKAIALSDDYLNRLYQGRL